MLHKSAQQRASSRADGAVVAVALNVVSGGVVLAASLSWRGTLEVDVGVASGVGLTAVYGGLLVVGWAARHLGPAMLGLISPTSGRLAVGGPFRVVRHPVYLGTAIALAGVAVTARSWAGLLATALIFVPSEIHRARKEEAALERAFGSEWKAYENRTPFLIPRWRPGAARK